MICKAEKLFIYLCFFLSFRSKDFQIHLSSFCIFRKFNYPISLRQSLSIKFKPLSNSWISAENVFFMSFCSVHFSIASYCGNFTSANLISFLFVIKNAVSKVVSTSGPNNRHICCECDTRTHINARTHTQIETFHPYEFVVWLPLYATLPFIIHHSWRLSVNDSTL